MCTNGISSTVRDSGSRRAIARSRRARARIAFAGWDATGRFRRPCSTRILSSHASEILCLPVALGPTLSPGAPGSSHGQRQNALTGGLFPPERLHRAHAIRVLVGHVNGLSGVGVQVEQQLPVPVEIAGARTDRHGLPAVVPDGRGCRGVRTPGDRAAAAQWRRAARLESSHRASASVARRRTPSGGVMPGRSQTVGVTSLTSMNWGRMAPRAVIWRGQLTMSGVRPPSNIDSIRVPAWAFRAIIDRVPVRGRWSHCPADSGPERGH